jgi:cytochrome c-type biogenesis protein CcmH
MNVFRKMKASNKTFYHLCILLLMVVVLPGLITRTIYAQQATPSDDDVNAVAKQMYCPVCENIPLDVCPTTACAQWRDLIRQKLSEGWTDQQIKDYFVAQYGDRVLAEPPRVGLNWLVYILPGIFFLGGVVVVIQVLRKMRAVKQAAEPELPTPGLDDPYLSRLEDELRHRERS